MNNVKIVEVGPRDGLQNEKTIVPTQTKIQFIKMLIEAGLSSLEVTSFVKASKIPQMQDAEEVFKGVIDFCHANKAQASCLVPNLVGLHKAIDLGVSDIAIFTATSNTFNQKNINATVDESLIRLQEVCEYIKNHHSEINIRGYVSTVFGCPYEGNISVEANLRLIDSLFKMGVYEVSLGDTIGVANPKQVKDLVSQVKKNFDLSKIAMHFHDTEGVALLNIHTSYEEGIRIFDSSAAGLGGCPYAKGATGNVATDDVVNLFSKIGVNTGIDAMKLHQASKYILSEINRSSASKFFNAFEGRLL